MKESAGTALDQILKSLAECNSIKYVAYRTAAKIRKLQKAFFFEKLPVDILGGVLQQHHLTCTENSVRLTPSELCNLLEDVYFVISREHVPCIDTDYSVNLLSRFILHVLQKENGVELLGVKVILCVLCGSKPKDKYNYLFSQLADHNSVLTSRRLELLLQRLVLLTDYIGEGRSFGRTLIPGTVQSCFKELPVGSLGVSLENFTSWLAQDPQLLVWLSTLHRLNLADSVVHAVKCIDCKTSPIVGLRYRCLRCLGYNQCQNCFFLGLSSKSHKKTHPVQEYCYQSTAKQSLRALLATLRNKLKRNGWKLQYLPANENASYLDQTTLQLDQLNETTKTLSRTANFSLSELENVIAELEEQSCKLLRSVDDLKKSEVKNILDDHRVLVEKQVDRLKSLRNQLYRQRNNVMVNSTPCARLARQNVGIDAISPITSHSLALTWDKYDIGETEEGPCVLTWEGGSGSSSSDIDPKPATSPAYTWLQTTDIHTAISPQGTIPEINKEKDQPEDIQALHDDLDQILNKLQQLLANSCAEPDPSTSPGSQQNNMMGHIMDRL